MNEIFDLQLSLDFRTGRPTAITGPAVSVEGRSACAALNRERIRGLTEADRNTASRESLSPHAWAALFARKCAEWGVPLIPLSRLGISHNDERLITSSFLTPLTSGAEASPFKDQEWGVVYKLFPLLRSGGLGKTFAMEFSEESNEATISTRDATLFETIEKLTTLSEAGALLTEIVGLTDSGDYLIVKQPLAFPHRDFEVDRQCAVDVIRAVPCRAPFGRPLWTIWMHGQPYFVSDLHKGNIMRDAGDVPAIIDALFCPVPRSAIRLFRWLGESVEDARSWQLSGCKPSRKAFDEVNDDDL